MRKKRWIAPVWGMLATAAFGQAASAQAPGSPLDAPFPPAPPPAGPPVAPGPAQYAANPTYTPIAPDAASPAGFPPGMRPWPTISPFDNAFDQTSNQDGIWFRTMLNDQRRYNITAEFISARFRQPGNVSVGSEAFIANSARGGVDAPLANLYGVKDVMIYSGRGRYFIENDGTIDYPDPPGAQAGPLPRTPNFSLEVIGGEGPGQDEVTDDFVFDLPKAGLLQVVNLFDDDPDTGIEDNEDDVDDEISDTVLYPVTGQVLGEDAVTRFGGDPNVVNEKRENPASPGIRMTFGVENEDQSGFDWTGVFIDDQATVFSRGLDDAGGAGNQFGLNLGSERLTNIVFFDAPNLGGEDAVEWLDYNILFRLKHESMVAGTDLAFYHTPMVDYEWLRVRPLYGARYDYIRETFNFTGRDSGFAAVYDASGVPTALTNSIPLTFEEPFFFSVLNPYETNVTSRVRSHLYGPEVGFDMEMGGEYLMLSAVTKAGVVANTEKLTLDAAGFGVNEALTGIRGFKSDAKTHTHVSPFLEIKTNADFNVFPLVPYVNRWNWLKNARVRAGYTAFVVGNLSRPMDNIVWRAESSGGPYIKDRSRDAWYTQYWNLGVHWNF